MAGDPGETRYHEFRKDLAYSLEGRESDFLDDFYRRIFPDAVDVKTVSEIGLQRKGVDKEITLASGRKLWVDEKKRRQWYSDILLEWEHRYPNGFVKPGWCRLPLECDFVAYVFLNAQVAYLLPFVLLRMAIGLHGESWVAQYGLRASPNRDYISMNVPVPREVLFTAIKDQLIQSAGPVQSELPGANGKRLA